MSVQDRTKHKELYKRCYSIKHRCLNPNEPRYKDYGGRGVELHRDWLNNYPGMVEYMLSIGYTNELTIDRINNDGNYEPGNLRMATMKQQRHNRRNHNTNKLNKEDVIEVHYLNNEGILKQRTIGNLFNVNQSVISRIKSGIAWKEVI